MRRNKIKLTTNRGKLFDWFLNKWLNWKLWLYGIDDNADDATKLVAKELKKLGLV